jgi:hypothetical protein
VLKTRFCLLSVGAVDVVVPFLYRRYQKKKCQVQKKSKTRSKRSYDSDTQKEKSTVLCLKEKGKRGGG